MAAAAFRLRVGIAGGLRASWAWSAASALESAAFCRVICAELTPGVVVAVLSCVDLIAANDEVERQLSVEEEIERRTAQEHTDTPHFRKDAE